MGLTAIFSCDPQARSGAHVVGKRLVAAPQIRDDRRVSSEIHCLLTSVQVSKYRFSRSIYDRNEENYTI